MFSPKNKHLLRVLAITYQDSSPLDPGLFLDLQTWNVDLEQIRAGSLALAAMAGNAYDLFFVDEAPDGSETLAFIKEAVEGGCQAPIILLSEQASPIMELEALQAGVSGYLITHQLTSAFLEHTLISTLHYWERLKTSQEQHQVAEVLHEVTIALNSALNFEELLALILSTVERVVPHDAADIMLIEEAGQARMVGHQGYVQQGRAAITEYTFSIDRYRTFQRMMETGVPLLIPDTHHSDLWIIHPEREWIRGYMGAPIHSRGQIVGFLNLASFTPNFFTQSHLMRLQIFAAQVGIAIGNGRLLEVERKQREIAETLSRVGVALNSTLDLPELSDLICRESLKVFQVETALIWLVQGDELFGYAGSGPGREQFIGLKISLADPKSLGARVIREKRPRFVNYAAQSDQVNRELTELLQAQAILGIPIVREDRAIGALMIIDQHQPYKFRKDDIETATIFGNYAAVAVQNAQLFDQTQTALVRTDALYRATRMLIGIEKLTDLLQAVADGAAEALPAHRVTLILIDLEKCHVTHFVDGGTKVEHPFRASFDELWEGLTGWVLRERKPALSLSGEVDFRESRRVQQRRKQRETGSIIVVPLQYRGTLIGTLTAANLLDQPDFNDQDVELLTILGNQAAVAVENVRLLEAERTARQQAELLREQTRQTLAQTTRLYELSTEFTSALSLAEVAHLVIEKVVQATQAHSAIINLLDEAGNFEQAFGMPEAPPRPGGSTMTIHRTGEALIINDIRDTPEKVHPQLTQQGLQASIGLPLKTREQTLGVLFVRFSEPHQFSQREVETLFIFANQAAIAIHNARLYQKVQQYADAEHQRLERLVAHLPNGLVLLNPEHRLVLINHAARNSLTALAQVQLGDKLTHLGQYPLQKFLDSALTDPTIVTEIEAFPNRKIEVTARPVTSGPEKGGYILIIRDVTEERLIQKQVQRQERMAAVGQLAAGIAHDFNNILTSIIGFAELLQLNPGLPESAQADLERITKQGQRAARLVRQILDFSSHTITEKRPLDLRLFLKEVIKLLERTIPEDIRISLETEAREYIVTADLTQIQQAITNLALNARDAMPEGGQLQFQLSQFILSVGDNPPYPQLGPGNWIRLVVSDTGIGIPTELHAQIFEPFFTTKQVGQGTGLGLAQVYGIIKQHEGYIYVESEVGAGATFNIYLPALSTSGNNRVQEEARLETAPRGNNQLVLLVEDDASVRYIGTSMLKYLGYRVLTAAQGQEALAIYEEHQAEIEVVLTDMTMPEMGGAELARLLHARNPAIKVIMLTGYALKTGSEELQTPGVQDWLQKPLKLEQLAKAVNRLVETGS